MKIINTCVVEAFHFFILSSVLFCEHRTAHRLTHIEDEHVLEKSS